MALKKKVAKIEDVPEKFRELYEKQDDGTFALATEDDSDESSRLDEFRNNNRKLFGQVEELKKQLERFKNIDPDKYADAMELLKKVEASEEAESLKKGDFEGVFNKRAGAMKREHAAALKSVQDSLDKLQVEHKKVRGRLGEMLINTQVAETINKLGKVRQGALQDITLRARTTWEVDENGELVPRRNGETVYGKDSKPLTMEEWASSLIKEAPYLFEPAQGGGAGGSKGTAGGSGKVRVNRNDPVQMGKHAEEIAKGKAEVYDG